MVEEQVTIEKEDAEQESVQTKTRTNVQTDGSLEEELEDEQDDVVHCQNCNTKLQETETSDVKGEQKVVNPRFDVDNTLENIETQTVETLRNSTGKTEHHSDSEKEYPLISAMQALENSITEDETQLEDDNSTTHLCTECSKQDLEDEVEKTIGDEEEKEGTESVLSFESKVLLSGFTAFATANLINHIVTVQTSSGLSYHTIPLFIIVFGLTVAFLDSDWF